MSLFFQNSKQSNSMAALNKRFQPNKSQNAAIRHRPSPLMILAGAGTGKTFTLQNRIVHLINY